MFKLFSASRQVLRASLREKEKGRGLASSQPAPPHFLFRCLLEDQEPQPQHGSTRVSVATQLCGGKPHHLSHLIPPHSLEIKEWWNNKSKGREGGRNVHLERSLLEVLCWGGVVSLALHLFHDRNNIDWRVLNRVVFGEQEVDRPLSSGAYCPVVNIKQNRTVLAQPKEDDQVFSEGKEALLLLQHTSLLEQPTRQEEEEEILSYQRTPLSAQKECLIEVKSKVEEEKEKQILCREWIGDEETSDYSSQSSSEKGEVFPFGLTLEEKALLKLEEVIAPLELEAAEAISAVKMGEGISRLEEVAQRGSATGQFYLGMAYHHGLAIGGLTVEPAPDKAMHLYRAAADQNHHEAEYNLAVMLLEIDPESDEAFRLLQTAAREGVKQAQEVLVDESHEKDTSGQVEELFEEREDILGKVTDGGEELYQWGRQWEKAAAKSRGDEWVQALPLFKKAASVGHKRASERFRKLSKRWGEAPKL